MEYQGLDNQQFSPEDPKFETSDDVEIPEGISREGDLPSDRSPKSPGDILREVYLSPLDLSQEEFAETIGVTRRRINEIVNDKRRITPETALRLARSLHTSPMFWMSLQDRFDLWKTKENENLDDDLDSVEKVV